jgi:hypothetical protein
MKKLISYIVVLALGGLIITACKKKEKVVEETPAPTPTPDPYTYSADLQSSKDISFATSLISDIEMMGSFMGEEILNTTFYNFIPGTEGTLGFGTGTYSCVRDDGANFATMAFNKTKCLDGKTRNGSVFMLYDQAAIKTGAGHARDFQFAGDISFGNFVVDGYKIELYDPNAPMKLINTVTSSGYNPATTNLTWKIIAKIKLTHDDPSKNMVWDGVLTKTLTNTGDPTVFAQDKASAINWNKAKIAYSGMVTGMTAGSVPFSCSIDNSNPIKREFTCAFVPTGTSGVTEFHPLIGGVASFTTSNFHPRIINYGPTATCDNSGTVTFKDETYNVDFN